MTGTEKLKEIEALEIEAATYMRMIESYLRMMKMVKAVPGKRAAAKKTAEQLQATQKKADEAIDRLADEKERVLVKIREMESPTQQKILIGKYFDGMTMLQLAEKLGMSAGQTARLHAVALDGFDKVWGEDE